MTWNTGDSAHRRLGTPTTRHTDDFAEPCLPVEGHAYDGDVSGASRRHGPPGATAAASFSRGPQERSRRDARPDATAEAAVVVVPVKAFSKAKMRLAGVLSPQERAGLARKMAEHVLSASKPLPVVVVCDDVEVEEWAEGLGARPLPEPGRGLNGAVKAAFDQLGKEGYERLVVAHADLPLASELAWLADVEGIALVPDRRDEGTNVISLPAGCGFSFSYGPGSFLRHQEEARRTGLMWQVIRDPRLAWDVDFPADMTAVTS
jgi:2-phospho-L-lactate/phosphoenolpyruvate guanylyltransferase